LFGFQPPIFLEIGKNWRLNKMNGNNVDEKLKKGDYFLKTERKQRLQLLWVSEFMKNFMK